MMRPKLLNPKLIDLVNILQDGKSHDGTSLGRQLNITRSAVWKLITKLKSYGLAITSLQSNGYALLEPLILLNQTWLRQEVNIPSLEIEVFESLSSTNDYLRKFKGTGPRICLAEFQTQGRGRMQRHWHSPFGKNIYFSCLYIFQKDISTLAGLSLVVCLAIIKSLECYLPSPCLRAKWPNDVLAQGKKLAGTLIEIEGETNGVSQVIIGIGLNVNMAAYNKTPITQPWIALDQIVGKSLDRNRICISLIDTLFKYLAQFETAGLLPFIEEWHSVDLLYGQEISLHTVQDEFIKGKAIGITSTGQILLQNLAGEVQAYSSGEVSIQK